MATVSGLVPLLTWGFIIGVGLLLLYAIGKALRARRAGEDVERTAVRAGDNVRFLTRDILTVTRVLVVTLIAIGFQVIGEFTTLLTEFGGLLAEVAVPVSNLLAIGLGYLGWTGALAMPPQYFALGALLALTVAVVVRDA